MSQDEPNAGGDTAQSQTLGAFLNLEYQETHRYFLQIESTMHDLLKFYTVSLLGLISVSVALAEFVFQDGAEVPLWATLAALWFVFAVVGLLQLHYYVELRIRKIKMVEQLAAIRDHYLRPHKHLAHLLRLIPSVPKSPPFLRRPSAEWYSVLYYCAANTGVALFAIFSLDKEWGFLRDLVGPRYTASALILSACALALFLYQFCSVTALAYGQDLKREQEVGESQYDLFVHGEVPRVFQVINWVACRTEAFVRCRHRKAGA